MSDQKPPRWKSEVTRPDPARPEATLPQPITIDTGDVAAGKAETSSADVSSTDPKSAAPRKPAAVKKPVPKQAIMIGIVGGAVLGALLAWGVLSFIWWRRDVNREADFAAEVKAQQQAEAAKKQTEMNDAMRQFSIGNGNR
jgi:hypothetical protein